MIDFINKYWLISSTLPFLHRKVWNSYLIAGKKSSYSKSTELQVELKTIPLEVLKLVKPRTNWNIDVPIKAGTHLLIYSRKGQHASDTK